MKWIASRSSKSSQSAAPPSVDLQPSLALNVLFSHLKADRKYHILDLGPALGCNVDFLSNFRCQLRLEDLYEALDSIDFSGCATPNDRQTIVQNLLPYPQETRFDIVLSWDLFNYLERDIVRQLAVYLARFCHQGTVLYALISTARTIPDKPVLYKIVDASNLVYESRSQALRPCPRYHDQDLRHLLPGFRVYNSFLLRNGMKEYLFVFG